MNDHAERLNTWHLELAIVADAIEHVLTDIDGLHGLSAMAYVLKERLQELVENCPFPEAGQTRIMPVSDLDPDDFDSSLSDDFDGVPAELLTGGRDD